MAKEYRLSAERLEELKQELTYLKTVREKEVAELIKEARSFGDLSENSEYDEAKNEQGKLYSRIAELDEILSNYTIIEEQETARDIVHVGNNVVVKDLEFDETLTYQIVGSQEADPMNGRISEDSPFGKALLGKKAGEEVVVEAPAGNIHYQILEIQSRTCPKSSRCAGTSWPPSRRRGRTPSSRPSLRFPPTPRRSKTTSRRWRASPSPSLAG